MRKMCIRDRAVVKQADAPLSHGDAVLFLASHLARLASRAEFVVDEQTVCRHLNHQLSEAVPHFHHVGVVVLCERLHAAEDALERRAETELADVLVRDELVDVGAPHLVERRLFAVLFREPEACLLYTSRCV